MGTIAYQTISWSWIIFIIYWIVSAFRGKAVAERQDRQAAMAYKLPTLLGAILLWNRGWPGPMAWKLTPQSELMALAGAGLCAAGLLVAIWARRTLAGNWSSDVTFKQGHELVKTGPYALARHPIYTGLLMMTLGTAGASGRIHSWLGAVLMFTGFWIKLKGEEELMLRHFPDQYPAYRREVKAIVPFIL